MRQEFIKDKKISNQILLFFLEFQTEPKAIYLKLVERKRKKEKIGLFFFLWFCKKINKNEK